MEDDTSKVMSSSKTMRIRRNVTHHDDEQEPLLYPCGDTDAGSRASPMHGEAIAERNPRTVSGQQLSENNDADGEKGQMPFMVLFSALLIFIAITFVQSLSPYMIQNYDCSVAQAVMISYMLLGTVVIFAMYGCMHNFTEPRRPVSDSSSPRIRENVKYILRNYLSIIGMCFFFPFACILDFCHIVAAASCVSMVKLCEDEVYKQYWVDVFFYLMRIIFMSSELLFCFQFHTARFRQTVIAKCGLMIIMAVNLGLWFLSLLYSMEDRNEFKQCHGNISEKCNITIYVNVSDDLKLCFNKSTRAFNIQQTLSRYLYPFTIEFSLLVGEFLAAKFFFRGKQEFAAEQAITAESNADRSIIIQPTPTVQPHSGYHEEQQFLLSSVIIVGIGISANIVYLCVSFLDNNFVNSDLLTKEGVLELQNAESQTSDTYQALAVFAFVVLDALLVVGFFCGSAFQVRTKALRGIDWLVLTSAFGPLLYALILITAAASNFSRVAPLENPLMFIATKTLNLFQFILQTPFLFYADRWRLTDDQRSQPRLLRLEKILKAIILCMAITNLTNWIVDSVILTNSSVMKQDFRNKIFKNDLGSFLVDVIILPFMIFYRFNSFLLFVRAYFGQ